jgi:hypothetical protein
MFIQLAVNGSRSGAEHPALRHLSSSAWCRRHSHTLRGQPSSPLGSMP